jgi:CheY-like chemotaxis protein
MFSKFGVSCEVAENGLEALTLIEESLDDRATMGFDMVVMDNNMPVMSGPEACLKMRRAGFTKPIFGLTGQALEEDQREFLENGANYVFVKPLNVKELCGVV